MINTEQQNEQKTTLSPVEGAQENFEEVLESILFAAGHPVTYEKLGELFEMTPSIVKVSSTLVAHWRNWVPRSDRTR